MVFLWWCSCDGVLVVVFLWCKKDVSYKKNPFSAHIYIHIKHFLYLIVFIAFEISGV